MSIVKKPRNSLKTELFFFIYKFRGVPETIGTGSSVRIS